MTNPHTISDALAIATSWISTTGLPFRSAFLGGSAAYADPHRPYDPATDIDCYLVVSGDPPEGKIGKIVVEGVLLDVSWLVWEQLAAGTTHAVLASLLRFGQVVLDADGELTRLQRDIITTFADAGMIAQRLEDMSTRIRHGLAGDSSHLSSPEQVMNWLFPATLATHIPLVAACAPLTVRKRFLAARKVMAPAAYASLLALYGFDWVSQELAQRWLDETASLFRATTALAAQSDRFWASDIQEPAQSIAIGGSQQLIDTGDHREALYWIIAISARCLTVREDAGVDSSPFMPAFKEMTALLMIASPEQRSARSDGILTWVDKQMKRY